MRQVDGLRALEVRVAGHRPVEVALRELRPAPPSARGTCICVRLVCARRTSPCRSRPGRCATAPVCSFPPSGPASSVRRRSIAMWMSSSGAVNSNVPSSSSRATAEARCRSPSRPRRQCPSRPASRRARWTARCPGREPTVEADRGVKPLKDRVGWLPKPCHSRQFRAGSDRVRLGSELQATRAGRRRPSTCSSLIAVKKGSASERAATRSATGNSPSRSRTARGRTAEGGCRAGRPWLRCPDREALDHGVAVDAVRELHDVDEPAPPAQTVVRAGSRTLRIPQALPVEGRDPCALGEDPVRTLELRDADRRGEVGEPVVEAEPVVCDHVMSSPRPWFRSLSRLLARTHGSRRSSIPPSPVTSCLLA